MNRRHSAKTLCVVGVLTVLIAFMDISGFPSALFVHIEFADIEPIYFALAVNFVIICALPYCFTTFSGYPTVSLLILLVAYVALGAYGVFLMARNASR